MNEEFYAKAQANLTRGYPGSFDASNAYNTQLEAPPPPSLTGDVSQRLGTLTMLLGDVNGDLVMLNDRLFGSAPRCVAANAADAAKPMGQAGELLAALDVLVEQANCARDEARRLNARI